MRRSDAIQNPWILGLLPGIVLFAANGCGVAAFSHNSTGVQHYLTRNYPAARQEFQQAIAVAPEDANGYYNLAATLHRLGVERRQAGPSAEASELLNQAENLYNQALDKQPNHDESYRGLAVLLVETDRSDKAFALLRNWLLTNPTSPDARVRLAQLYEEFGQAEEAKHYLQEALAQNPQNTRALNALAKLREDSGDLAQAIANYQRSLQVDARQPQIASRVTSLQQRAWGINPPGTTTATAPPSQKRY
jgi:tetratricopeptide (TPR) repeat protein